MGEIKGCPYSAPGITTIKSKMGKFSSFFFRPRGLGCDFMSRDCSSFSGPDKYIKLKITGQGLQKD